MLRGLRRTLGRRVSVAALIEFALWLTIPYVTVGVVWAFLHPGQVQDFESALLLRVPAGADMIGFGLTAAIWPVLVIVPAVCGS